MDLAMKQTLEIPLDYGNAGVGWIKIWRHFPTLYEIENMYEIEITEASSHGEGKCAKVLLNEETCRRLARFLPKDRRSPYA